MKAQLLLEDPEIVLFGNFLSAGEARELLAMAEGHFTSSKITCEKSGGCVSDYRTSSTAYLAKNALTTEIAGRGMRLAGLRFAEDLQVVRYFPGQQFKPHLDAFDPSTESSRKELAGYGGRQRDATFLIYLNKPEAGGATKFTNLGLEIEPSPGAALYWRNVSENGKIDPRTMHAGMPVISGVKYAINLWVRGTRVLEGFDDKKVSSMPALRNFQKNFIQKAVFIGQFPAAAEADGKLKIERRTYDGTGHTLQRMAEFIREASVSPAMKQFAEMVVLNSGAPPGQHLTNAQAGEILLSYVKANVRYRPDPENQEMVQKADLTLCVPGAVMCIPVGDCDDRVVALAGLMGAYGIPVKIMKQNFGDADEHVIAVFQTDDKRWLAADPSAPARYGVGWRAEAKDEIIVDPLDPTNSGNVMSEFVGVGRPRFDLKLTNAFIGTAHDDAVALQTRLKDLALATALAIEACRVPGGGSGSALTLLQQTQWTDLAQRVLAFVSADSDTVDLTVGETMGTELAAWGDVLRAAGCAAPVPAPIPVPAVPVPTPAGAGTDWEGIAKLGLYTVMFGVGAYALTQVVEIAKIGSEMQHHVGGAATEARRLIRRRR